MERLEWMMESLMGHEKGDKPGKVGFSNEDSEKLHKTLEETRAKLATELVANAWPEQQFEIDARRSLHLEQRPRGPVAVFSAGRGRLFLAQSVTDIAQTR